MIAATQPTFRLSEYYLFIYLFLFIDIFGVDNSIIYFPDIG